MGNVFLDSLVFICWPVHLIWLINLSTIILSSFDQTLSEFFKIPWPLTLPALHFTVHDNPHSIQHYTIFQHDTALLNNAWIQLNLK
jgi:hypothetical protein